MDNLLNNLITFQIIWGVAFMVVAVPFFWLLYKGLDLLKEEISEQSTTPSDEEE